MEKAESCYPYKGYENPFQLTTYYFSANDVLEQALKPGINGVPKDLFQECCGMIMISIVEVGFIFSGNVGTGIILAKQDDGSWSPPCACGLTGIGFGLLAGGSVKDVMVFIMDKDTMRTAAASRGIKLGSQAEVTVGPFGRAGQTDIGLSREGAGATVAIAFSKGAFAGLNLTGAFTGTRNAVNDLFYGTVTTPQGILFDQAFQIPEGKVTMIDEVYQKLEKLSKGKTAEPDPSEEAKKSAAMSEADKVAESVNSQPGVEQVDAAVEASKEQQST